jgi:RimJ/RimL family protein N-acetyltransferase
MGYLFRKEFWGKGFATEFVRRFLRAWWSLERDTRDIEVDRSTVRGNGDTKEEVITASTIAGNSASENVIRKTGFHPVKTWKAALREHGQPLTLHGFAASSQDLK